MSRGKSLSVLVTGGSGFVGSAVVEELLARGHTVIATSNVITAALPRKQGLTWVLWDAMEHPLPDVDWSGLQAMLHLAMPERYFDFPAQAVPIYELAVASTFHLLEKARASGLGRVLVASTGEVLGHRADPGREDDLLYLPESFHGATKACGELLTRAYQQVLASAVLRFFHPYGPGGDRFLVGRLLTTVAQGREVHIEGEEGIQLNPVWVGDLAVGVRQAIESAATGVFHLAGPDLLTLRQLVMLMGSLLNKEPVIRTKPKANLAQHAGRCESARRVLGYNPKVTLREGLQRLIGGPRRGSEPKR